MAALPPLPVALPFLAAAALAILSPLARHRRLIDSLSVTSALAVFFCSLALFMRSQHGTIVYWFGGWAPAQYPGVGPVTAETIVGAGSSQLPLIPLGADSVRTIAPGIGFVVDPVGAALAAFASLLVFLVFVFAWHYFEEHRTTVFHTLIFVFAGAMNGFCLSGDLFNMFVFFELMGVAAYALTGTRSEAKSPLQGGLNFLVMNSLGAFLVLLGIGLVYGRTGALNLAQVGRSLASGPADPLVRLAFALLTAGFLVKAAIVPFHFWLPDAHAVAPTPVSVLFSGIMVELGLYAVARIYWTGFGGVAAGGIRPFLLAIAAATTLAGGVLCLVQDHVKRLLAFSTVSHAGILLLAFGLLDREATAGGFLYLLGHGAVKAALFFAAGIVINAYDSADIGRLHGRARDLQLTGIVCAVGAAALAGLPPFGLFAGKEMFEHAAHRLGYAWIPWVAAAGSALTGAGVLRMAGSVFLGWGTAEPITKAGSFEDEPSERPARAPWPMVAPVLVLLACALALGLVPGVEEMAGRAAIRFHDREGYAAAVLGGEPAQGAAVLEGTAAPHLAGSPAGRPVGSAAGSPAVDPPGSTGRLLDIGDAPDPPPETASDGTIMVVEPGGPELRREPAGPQREDRGKGALIGAGTVVLAVLIAWLVMVRHSLPPSVRRFFRYFIVPALDAGRKLQSGYVGDYVIWFVFGAFLFAAATALWGL